MDASVCKTDGGTGGGTGGTDAGAASGIDCDLERSEAFGSLDPRADFALSCGASVWPESLVESEAWEAISSVS